MGQPILTTLSTEIAINLLWNVKYNVQLNLANVLIKCIMLHLLYFKYLPHTTGISHTNIVFSVTNSFHLHSVTFSLLVNHTPLSGLIKQHNFTTNFSQKFSSYYYTLTITCYLNQPVLL